MTATVKDFFLFDGNRFAWDLNSFARTVLPLDVPDLKAKRTQAPFIDAEITSFAGGVAADDLADEGTTLSAVVGFAPSGAVGGTATPWLSVAHAPGTSHSAAGSGVLYPLAADAGYLFAADRSSTVVVWDGASWTARNTGGTTALGIGALAARGGSAVLVGYPDAGHLRLSLDHGVNWSTAAVLDTGVATGTGLILAMDDFSTQELGALWLIISTKGVGTGRAHGSTMSLNNDVGGGAGFYLAEQTATAGCVDGATAYFCGSDTTTPLRGQLYSYQVGDQPSPLAELSDNYATAMAFYQGVVYLACYQRGELYAYDGSGLRPVRTFATTLPIRGMAVAAGALWVAAYNDAAGRMELWRFDGTGWTLPHTLVGSESFAGGLATYGGALYVGAGTTGSARRVYAVSATDYNTAAQLDTPDVTYGAPGLSKRYRAASLQHAALAAGQSVAAAYSVDGGATWGTVLTNYAAGATETAADLGDDVLATRARFRFAYSGGTAQPFTAYSAVVRALPAPESREVWEVDLRLRAKGSGAWADGTADTADALGKYALLDALRGTTFQAVGPLGGAAGYPDRAMLATLDPQVPLRWRMIEVIQGTVHDIEAIVPVRLVQAAGAANLLDNASFERDLGVTPPAAWSVLGSGSVAAASTAVPAVARLHSALIAFDGTSSSYGLQQTISPLVPGRYYTLSAYLRTDSLSHGDVRADVFESGVLDYQAASIAPVSAALAAWAFHSVSFLYPANGSGTVQARLYGEGTPAGVIAWDAVQLEEQVPASAFRERGT